MSSLHDLEATSIDGERVDLSSYAGQVVLIVNTASQCGFTPQYRDCRSCTMTTATRG